MVQLYELFVRAAKDREHAFPKELQTSIPKSRREYAENINFEEFEAANEEKRIGIKENELSEQQLSESLEKLSIAN